MNILYPLYGMVILTICIAPLVLYARVKQVNAGNLKIGFFELYDGTGARPMSQKRHAVYRIFLKCQLYFMLPA